MMESELKPVRRSRSGEAIYGKWVRKVGVIAHAVGCKNCGIQTKPYPTEAEAVQAWNSAMGAENICKNCKAYFVMGDCGYCKYDDEYPTADGYGCNCFSRRES